MKHIPNIMDIIASAADGRANHVTIPTNKSMMSTLPIKLQAMLELICASVMLDSPRVMGIVECSPPFLQKSFSRLQESRVTVIGSFIENIISVGSI